MTEAVDLTGFLPTEDHILEIVSPAGKPTGWKITLGATSHPKAVAFAEAEARRTLDRAKVLREAQFNGRRYDGDDGKTPDQVRRDSVQGIVARIIGWTPVKIGDRDYSFSDQNAEDLLILPELGFALDQITKALRDEARFTKRSAGA